MLPGLARGMRYAYSIRALPPKNHEPVSLGYAEGLRRGTETCASAYVCLPPLGILLAGCLDSPSNQWSNLSSPVDVCTRPGGDGGTPPPPPQTFEDESTPPFFVSTIPYESGWPNNVLHRQKNQITPPHPEGQAQKTGCFPLLFGKERRAAANETPESSRPAECIYITPEKRRTGVTHRLGDGHGHGRGHGYG